MPIIGVIDSQKSGHLYTIAGSYEQIASVVVPSIGLSSVVFEAIPQIYKHLQIRAIMSHSTATAPGVYCDINGDTTSSNYYSHRLQGDGTSASAVANQLSLIGTNMSTSTTAWHCLIIDILDYTNTNKYKTSRSLGGYDNNGSGLLALTSQLWKNTNAITSLNISNKTDNWNQYSSFALYGVKG